MSRTDKDAPYWVRAEYYRPDHRWDCPDRIARSWQQYPRTSYCTLPPEPVLRDVSTPRSWRGRISPCIWVPDGWDRKYYTRPPKRDDRRIFFHGPTRREVRDFCIKAKQEYLGCGDVEAIEPPDMMPSQLDWWD